MKTNSPKLPLYEVERNFLRRHRVLLSELADMEAESLKGILECSLERAKTLIALATFQRLPDVGPRFAQDIVRLGYFSLDDLKGKSGAELFEHLETSYGCQIDPCVEDQFRMVVNYAENPDSQNRWWDFTEARKQYRTTHGYPETMPSRR